MQTPNRAIGRVRRILYDYRARCIEIGKYLEWQKNTPDDGHKSISNNYEHAIVNLSMRLAELEEQIYVEIRKLG